MRAALDLVDRDGLAKLSMRRLGSELSVEAMALYHYVPTKSALLIDLGQDVAETAVKKATAAARGGRTRYDRLRRFALELRSELVRHPGALSILASQPIHSPESVRLLDGIAERLHGEGGDPARGKRLVGAIVVLVLGHALAEAFCGEGGRRTDRHAADRGMASCQHSAYFGTGGQDLGRENFLFVLDALLNGVEPMDGQEETEV